MWELYASLATDLLYESGAPINMHLSDLGASKTLVCVLETVAWVGSVIKDGDQQMCLF